MHVVRPRLFWGGCVLLAALFFSGCSKTPEQLVQQAVKAEKAAQAALDRNDAKGARRAAERAREAEERLKSLLVTNAPNFQLMLGQFAKAQVAARNAQDHAEFAEEKQERKEKLSSLKIKTYQKAQGAIFTTILPPMAAAAQRASTATELSPVEKALSEQSWRLVSVLCNRSPRADGAPDWAGAAADLNTWSTNQPVEFKAFIGLTFVLLGQSDFALAEFETVNTNRLATANSRSIYYGGTALLYALQGWNHLASSQAEAFCKQAGTNLPLSGPQLLALFHAVSACESFQKGEFDRMDSALAQSIRAWPDNPVAIFLTGEQLAANGEWAKAADSLEARATGTEDQWIAERLAQRARDLRDGKGSAKALVFDTRFLVEVAAHSAMKAGKDSEFAKKVTKLLEEAGNFGQKLKQNLL